MLENVKNLVSHDKRKTFKVITETLEEIGYSIHHKVLDAKYSVPQHRERIIIVGFDKRIFKGEEQFKFPEPPDNQLRIGDILEETVEEMYTLSDKLWNYLQEHKRKLKINRILYLGDPLKGRAISTHSFSFYKKEKRVQTIATIPIAIKSVA